MNNTQSENQIHSFVSKLLRNKCRLASIFTAIFILSVSTVHAAPQQNLVTIMDGDNEVSAYSDKTTVGAIINERGIKVTDYDVVYPGFDSKVTNGLTIVIDRPKRVDVTCEGDTISYWTGADNFDEFIEMHDIALSEKDIVNLNETLGESVDSGYLELENEISITRVNTENQIIREEIPFETTVTKDDTLEKGKTVVKTEGKPGVKAIEYEIVYHDGTEVSRGVISEVIEVYPVNKVVVEGTKQPEPVKLVADPVVAPAPIAEPAVPASAVAAEVGTNTITVNGQVMSYSKMIPCTATAYDLSYESTGKRPGDYGYGITASGTYAKRGTVAVDPRVIPLGTKMYIVSSDGSIVYGLCTAEDTGGAIKGNKVDLFYDTKAECMQFGRRGVNVYILN